MSPYKFFPHSTCATAIAATLTAGCVETTQDCQIANQDGTLESPGSFYRCRDQQLNHGEGCGTEGYALAFAAKYAEVYMWDLYPQVGPEAQAFLDANLVCLQSTFLDETTPEMSCEEVAEAGFSAHLGCYLDSGICSVPLIDQIAIFLAVDPEDMTHPSQREALMDIALLCLS
jgi:hypothetical protein